jgi:putative transcriptional regulator
MTQLGTYLAKRSINKSDVSRKTGISKVRLSELTLNESTHLRAKELYLIALAIHVDPAVMFMEIHEGIELDEFS